MNGGLGESKPPHHHFMGVSGWGFPPFSLPIRACPWRAGNPPRPLLLLALCKPCVYCERMGDLRLTLPDDLHRWIKVQAATYDLRIPEFCERILEGARSQTWLQEHPPQSYPLFSGREFTQGGA